MVIHYLKFIDYLEKDFVNFLTKNAKSKTSEYLLFIIVDVFLQEEKEIFNVIKSFKNWIRIIHGEDIDLAHIRI